MELGEGLKLAEVLLDFIVGKYSLSFPSWNNLLPWKKSHSYLVFVCLTNWFLGVKFIFFTIQFPNINVTIQFHKVLNKENNCWELIMDFRDREKTWNLRYFPHKQMISVTVKQAAFEWFLFINSFVIICMHPRTVFKADELHSVVDELSVCWHKVSTCLLYTSRCV